MSGSLQDQLVKAGLVSEERAKALGKKKSRPGGGKRGGRSTGAHKRKGQGKARGKGTDDLARAYAIRAQTERREREEEAARRKAEAQRRRQTNAALRKIVKEHALNDEKAEIPRNFEYRGKIKRVYVTKEQQAALTKEDLGIAMVSGRSYLLPLTALAEVQKVQAEAVAWPLPDAKTDPEEEDYAEYKVPDDLMW